MHIAFIPYGKRSEVELLFRDMDAQKHYLKMLKGKKKVVILIQSQVRQLPFGIYEYVCPKEDGDKVLTTLKLRVNRYKVSDFYLKRLRKILQLDKIPEFETKLHYPWIRENVGILPVGVRYDDEATDKIGEYKGWTHEAI